MCCTILTLFSFSSFSLNRTHATHTLSARYEIFFKFRWIIVKKSVALWVVLVPHQSIRCDQIHRKFVVVTKNSENTLNAVKFEYNYVFMTTKWMGRFSTQLVVFSSTLPNIGVKRHQRKPQAVHTHTLNAHWLHRFLGSVRNWFSFWRLTTWRRNAEIKKKRERHLTTCSTLHIYTIAVSTHSSLLALLFEFS